MDPPVLENAKQPLAKGRELIGSRQKLLITIDHAEGGWRVAEEYLKDPVADDSDDDKRIKKAEKESANQPCSCLVISSSTEGV